MSPLLATPTDTGAHQGPVTDRALQQGSLYLADPDNQGSPLTPWWIALSELDYERRDHT